MSENIVERLSLAECMIWRLFTEFVLEIRKAGYKISVIKEIFNDALKRDLE